MNNTLQEQGTMRQWVGTSLQRAFIPLLVAGGCACALLFLPSCETINNPDGTSVTRLSPQGEVLLAQATELLMEYIREQLSDEEDPPSAEEQQRLQMQLALQQAIFEAVMANIQWRRDHPGEDVPDRLIRALDEAINAGARPSRVE